MEVRIQHLVPSAAGRSVLVQLDRTVAEAQPGLVVVLGKSLADGVAL
jgi:hypothetical protein